MTIQSFPRVENTVRKGDLVVYQGTRSYSSIEPYKYVRKDYWTVAVVESATRDGRVKTVKTSPHSLPIEAHPAQILVPAPLDPRIPAMRADFEDAEKAEWSDLDELRTYLRSKTPVD